MASRPIGKVGSDGGDCAEDRDHVYIERPMSNVNVHRKLSQSHDEAASATGQRNSLEGTRSFYNVRPTSPPTAPSRLSSRNSSRPLSPNTLSPASPTRLAAPMPTPRAFLTPKKPAAAMRLEQQRARAQMSPRSADTPAESGPSRGTFRSSEYGFSPDPVSLDAMVASAPTPASQRFRTGASLRHSITNMSTPPNIPHELSSEDLVCRRSSEKSDSTRAPYPKTPKRTKKYKNIENKQSTWFCGGRLMTGGFGLPSLLLCLVLFFGLTGVWVGTTGVWLWQHGTEYGLVKGGGIAIVVILVYLFGLASSSLIAASLRDPGIIPRNLDPDPPSTLNGDYYDADNREVVIKDGPVVVKYCETCKTYRPPRASHCRLCGNCVDGIDHHCSFLHTCVGKRNYLSFIVLIITATISIIYIVVFSAVHFSLLCHHDHISFGDAIKDSPGAAVSFLIGVGILPFILLLVWYHIRLLVNNLTTVEMLRASDGSAYPWSRKRPDNPFSQGSRMSNLLLASLGRPHFPSWIDASGWDVEDLREPNTALKDPRFAKELS